MPANPTNPFVSVIVTFHNNVDHVDQALALLDAQTFRDFQLILVDDQSSDGTTEALASAALARTHAELLALSPNGGVAAARNQAVLHATGDYVWFVDCDDHWDASILEILATAARDSGSDVVTCRAVRGVSAEDHEDRPLDGMGTRTTVDRDGAIRAVIDRRLRGYLWDKLIRRTLLAPDPFPPLTSQSDLAGILKVVAQLDSLTFLPEVLYTHLVRAGSITNSSNPNLRNLEYCWEQARALALQSHTFAEGDRDLEFFDYAEYYVAAVDSFYRSGSTSPESIAQLREIRKAMTIGAILRVARRNPAIGSAALAFKLAGQRIRPLYQAYRGRSRRAALGR